MYYFYIFRCNDSSLYCGSTKNLANREKIHNSGKGSKYIRAHGGGEIVYTEKLSSVSKALKREAEVKRWKRTKKLELVASVV